MADATPRYAATFIIRQAKMRAMPARYVTRYGALLMMLQKRAARADIAMMPHAASDAPPPLLRERYAIDIIAVEITPMFYATLLESMPPLARTE